MNKAEKLIQKQFLNDEEAIIRRLKTVYNQSYKDITGKISKLDMSIGQLQKAYADIGDEIGPLAGAVLKNAGNLTPDQAKETVQSMIQSKVYQKTYQEALKKEIGGICDMMLWEEYTAVSDYLTECYENGFIGTMMNFQSQGIPLIMPIDQEAMVRAVQLDSPISEGLYKHLGEDVGLLKRRITAEVSRGISSGMTYSQVADQIARKMMGTYENPGGSLAYASRIARTEGHRIQVQSSMDACYKAKDKGADVVKQWDSTLDGRTRESHAAVDGEIRDLDEKFSNGLRFPGDPWGGAAEVVNCRCALLQRAKWAMDEDELETLKERAAFFGLDKTDNFQDYKTKYMKETQAAPVKKEYLTKKKLEQKIADADDVLADLENQFKAYTSGYSYDEIVDAFGSLDDFTAGNNLTALKALKKQMDDLTTQKGEWAEMLNKKVVAAETKKLKKLQIQYQGELDDFDIKTYGNIWKDDVTTADWAAKQGAIPAKKQYFQGKLASATDPDDMKKWQDLLDSVDDFDKQGAAYYKIRQNLDKVTADLKNLQKSGKIGSKALDDRFSQERKDAAYWFTDKNGSVKAADAVLRDKAGQVWRSASEFEKDSIYDYTGSYHKYNEPLRGIEYGTNKFLGVGKVDLDQIGVSYAGYKPGEIHKKIDAVTSIINKSDLDCDIWVQRGCERRGMDKFFGISQSDFDLPEADLAAKLIGTTPIEYAFMSTGVAKGKGLNTSGGVLLNIYAPKGTKAMYIEPISQFGHGAGRSWDGISNQSTFGYEAELLFQRGTKLRVTKVEKTRSTIFVDLEVIEQGVF